MAMSEAGSLLVRFDNGSSDLYGYARGRGKSSGILSIYAKRWEKSEGYKAAIQEKAGATR